jgi:thioredoxin reductase (NADPH)
MKPVILIVDDDPHMLKSLEQDLKKQYSKLFHILLADSGHQGLKIIEQLKLRNEVIALFIVDQRMPQMTGVEFLEKTIDIFPEARRVLLSDYGDTDAIMQSINKVKVDFYLTKPCEPPELYLYPSLNDILDDWRSSYRPAFDGIKVISEKWSPRSHEIKEFLARNGIPYQWLDIESDEEARRLVSIVTSTRSSTSPTNSATNTIINSPTVSSSFTENDNNTNTYSNRSSTPSFNYSSLHLPFIIFPDGSYLVEPTNSQIAEKIGLKTHPQMTFYDLVIIGGGPAGLAAAVYGASEGLHTVLIERHAPGGQAGASSNIENYLGFPSGLTGYNLARRAVAQAIKFGAEILYPQEVTGIQVDSQYRIAKFADGADIRCHVMLIACGVTYRKMDNVKNIDKLTGAGVYYGASIVEALYYKCQDIYIVGGANSAGQAAIYFSKYAREVTLLVRSDSLAEKMSLYLVHQINETSNIRVWLNTVVTEVNGENKLENIALKNTKTGEQRTVPAAGLFIYIGAEPHTGWLDGVVQRDTHGFILTGLDLANNGHLQAWKIDHQTLLLETNIPGVFAAGDVRHGSIKRIAAGVGEGSTAIQLIHQYLKKM